MVRSGPGVMRPLPLLALLALAAAGSAAALAPPVPRGVRPDTAAHYAGETFTCLDGSKTIPFVAVNDGYCDCVDGSDEPGTPACVNGAFYCRNKGHEAKLLSTAFVDDGVCDCCDGTDELDGCSNTCLAKNAVVREELAQSVEQYKQALAKRGEYAAGAAQRRADMKARLGAVDGDIAAAEKEKEALEGERQKLEESAEERKAVRKAKHEEAQAALAKKRQEEDEAAAIAAAEEATAKAAEAAAAAAAAGAEGEAAAAGQEAAPAAEEETAEERGRRIASQWTHDPEAAGKAEGEAAAEGEGAEAGKDKEGGWLSSTWSKLKSAVQGDGPAEGEREIKDDGDIGEEGESHADGEAPAAGEHDWTATDYAYMDPDHDTELEKAKSDVTAAESKIQSLRDEKERLGRQVTFDYGADDAWLALASHCSEATGGQFSYRVCLFDKAAQVDTHAGHETSLGKWKGFENGYTEGVFDGGDLCHGHPARSMRVKFQCGLAESAWDASEPSTCAYAARMQTPAACRAEDLAHYEQRLAALVQEEAELAKEIEEEEAARKAARAAAAAAAAAGGGGGAKDEL